MIKACDKNKDGYIDYKEFVENISKHWLFYRFCDCLCNYW